MAMRGPTELQTSLCPHAARPGEGRNAGFAPSHHPLTTAATTTTLGVLTALPAAPGQSFYLSTLPSQSRKQLQHWHLQGWRSSSSHFDAALHNSALRQAVGPAASTFQLWKESPKREKVSGRAVQCCWDLLPPCGCSSSHVGTAKSCGDEHRPECTAQICDS